MDFRFYINVWRRHRTDILDTDQGRIQDSGKGGVDNSRNSAHARLLLCAYVVCATHERYCVR